MKKRGNTWINQIRNERGHITTDTAEREKVIKDYCEKRYANKLNKLEYMANSYKHTKYRGWIKN